MAIPLGGCSLDLPDCDQVRGNQPFRCFAKVQEQKQKQRSKEIGNYEKTHKKDLVLTYLSSLYIDKLP